MAALLLGACSSGGGAQQPHDDFLDKVEAVCRDASTKIRALDSSDAKAPSDLSDVVNDTADALGRLVAPKDLADDYDKYMTTVDADATDLHKIVAALDSNDTSAEQTALDDLTNSGITGDKLLNGMGAIRCRGLIPRNALTEAPPATDVSTPPTADTVPHDTTPATPPPTDTTTPNTPLSIDTTPDTASTTVNTSVTTTSLPKDLSVQGVAPAGYMWVATTPQDVGGLYTNPTIGSLVTSYAGGEIESIANSSMRASVYMVTLSEEFTAADTTAYQYWEAVDKGTDVVTPGGLSAHEELGAFTGQDCVVYTHGSTGVAICTPTGGGDLPLLDAWVAANPM